MGMNITPLTRPEVPLTTSNLIVDSDLSMENYNLQANNLHVGGSILQVVECIPSETVYLRTGVDSQNIVVLPFIQSTYYTGKLKIKKNTSKPYNYIDVYNIDGTRESFDANTTWTDVVLKDGTISAIVHTDTTDVYVGFTNNYLPLPTP